MDQAPPDSKRPRLATTPSWPSNGHQLLNAPSPSPTNHSHPYSAPPSHPPYSPNTQQHGPPHHSTVAPPPLPSLVGGQHPSAPAPYTYPPPPNPYSTGRPPESHQHPPHPAPLHNAAPPMLGPPPPPPPSQPHYPSRQEGRTPLPPHAQQQGPHPYAHSPSPQVSFNSHPNDERRHHEQDRYPRIQEHRQSNPSPVLLQPSGAASAPPPPPPLFPGYAAGQRDREPQMMVKADPGGPSSGDEINNNLAHIRRPHSTGNQQSDGLAGPGPGPGPAPPSHSSLPPQPVQQMQQMQQGPPPPPPHPPQDGRRHMSLDNAAQPPMYRQPMPMQSYAPSPTPVSHSTPYDYGLQYGPASSGINYDGVVSVAQKRKAQRASQACEKCRELKAKCDEQKPCKNCKEKKLECKYRETQPKALDKGTTDIMEAILGLREDLMNRMDGLDSRAARLERAIIKGGIKLEMGDEDNDGMDHGAAPAEAGFKHTPSSPRNLTPLTIPTQRTEGPYADNVDVVHGPAHDQASVQELSKDEDVEDENPPGPPVVPEKPSIPFNHTTVASMLLKWDPIRVLVQRHLDKERIKYISEFPIQQEQRRGLLRLYGRGEGSDNKWFDREASLEREQWAPTDAYDDNAYSDAGGGSSPPDCWGTTGGLSPISSTTSRNGSLTRTPLWDFSEDKVWTYVQSYKDNIQNMHPLIVPSQLDALVRVFLTHVEQSKTRHKPADVAGYVETAGYKRKRSPAPDGPNNTQNTPKVAPGEPRIERTIHNALVLLVLALGKISLHKTSIPDPALSASEPASNLNSPMISHHTYSARNGYAASAASPMQGSPPFVSNPYSSGPSPTDGFHHGTSSRRPSVGAATSALPRPVPRQRNMEIIPGLDYFSLATDILGNQRAGSTMRHVHAHILAGLYYGQLGRVMESYAHIKDASYALLLIMRPSLHRLAKLQQERPFYRGAVQSHRDNQMIFAFWSCLQLESDIIAELPLPQSSILQYEHQMPYPNVDLVMAKDGSQNGFSSEVLMSYTTQLYLRRTLNEIHQKLYNPELETPAQGVSGLPSRPHPTSTVYQYLIDQLQLDFVPSMFKFDPEDPNPASDILGARLRAKYWGAQNITLRPFIRQIMQFNFERSRNNRNSPAPISGGFSSDFTAPAIGPEAKSDKDIDDIIIDHAQKGIWALIQSTRSFHGLKDERFVITNVFGTAHAQWGNLLVLAAAYKDPTLNKYIREADLQDLFVKTIKFLRTVAHQSSSLAIDMRILEGLYKDFWPNLPRNYVDTAAPNTSFSSQGSGPVSLPPMAASHTPPSAVHLPSMSNMYPGSLPR